MGHRNSLLQRREILLWAVLFIVTLVASLGIGSLFSTRWITIFDQAGILLGLLLSCIAAAGILLGLVRGPHLQKLALRWLRARQFAHAGQVVEDFEKWVDAMVVPVGKDALMAEWIVRTLKPRRVSLLFTAAGRQPAAELARTLEGEVDFDPPAHEIEHGAAIFLVDFLDPQESRRLVRHYLERFVERGFERERIFVDTTSGTAPMSMGALQAAEKMSVSSIYVMGRMRDGERQGRILDPADPSQGEPRFMSDHTRRTESKTNVE